MTLKQPHVKTSHNDTSKFRMLFENKDMFSYNCYYTKYLKIPVTPASFDYVWCMSQAWRGRWGWQEQLDRVRQLSHLVPCVMYSCWSRGTKRGWRSWWEWCALLEVPCLLMIRCVLYFRNVLNELCYRLSFVLTEEIFLKKRTRRMFEFSEAYQLLAMASVRCRNVIHS